MIAFLAALGSAWDLAAKVLAFFGVGGKKAADPTAAIADEARERGRSDANLKTTKEGLDELSKAAEAGDRARDALVRDPDRVRDPGNPNARPWRPGPDA